MAEMIIQIIITLEEIDLTYEGIATWTIRVYLDFVIIEEIDLTYEGIATGTTWHLIDRIP